MKKLKNYFSTIDIGSNAIRMIIAEWSATKGVKIIEKYRLPIRLGTDVFETGAISAKSLKDSARAFKKFKDHTLAYNVEAIRAVGTSALREAKNQKAFVELIRRKSKIEIEIIDGVEEAKLVHMAVKKEVNLDNCSAILIDIGGGSVELTISENAQMTGTQSFAFGTVRILNKMKKKKLNETHLTTIIGEFMEPLHAFLESQVLGKKLSFAVGTGGNLESLGKLKPLLLGTHNYAFLSAAELDEMIKKLQKLTIKERIEKLKMRPDRADVIIPAALIIQMVMRQSGVDKILIPHVGLKDGLLISLIQQQHMKSLSI